MICAVNEKNEWNCAQKQRVSRIPYILWRHLRWCSRIYITYSLLRHPSRNPENVYVRLDYLISIDYSLDVTFHYYCHHSPFLLSAVVPVCHSSSSVFIYHELERATMMWLFASESFQARHPTVHFMVFGFLTLSMHRTRWTLNTV